MPGVATVPPLLTDVEFAVAFIVLDVLPVVAVPFEADCPQAERNVAAAAAIRASFSKFMY